MSTAHVRAVLSRARELYPTSRHLQRQWALCKLRGLPRVQVRIGEPSIDGRFPRTLEEAYRARRTLL